MTTCATIERILPDAVEKTAAALATESAARGVVLIEKDLERRFIRALQTSLDEAGVSGDVHKNKSVSWEQFPKVGRIDVWATADSWTAFFELKWGRGTLYNCIWDVAKMAVADAHGRCRAFLLAGAPLKDWEGAHGSEFFRDGAWQKTDFFNDRYCKYWLKWSYDVSARLLQIPKAIRTRLVTTAPLPVLGQPWELRCIRVTVEPGEWVSTP